MTPLELKVRHELEAEYVRMANEWFFKWHNINIEGRIVDVEDFYGGRFNTGGVEFWGTLQDLYWRSVEKYLVDLIHRIFERWEVDTRGYPLEQRRQSIDSISLALRQHAGKIVACATDTDRRLRGKGAPENVRPYNSTRIYTAANVAIGRLAEAHASLLNEVKLADTPRKRLSMLKRLEALGTEWRGTLTVLGFVIASISVAITLIRFVVG